MTEDRVLETSKAAQRGGFADSGPAPATGPILIIDKVRKRPDFLAANRASRIVTPGFILLVNKATCDDARVRIGITVTKKIGNAVVRARMKRRFRALMRDILPTHGFGGADHIMIGREKGIERDYAAMKDELIGALDRIRAGKSDAKPNFRPRRKNRR